MVQKRKGAGAALPPPQSSRRRSCCSRGPYPWHLQQLRHATPPQPDHHRIEEHPHLLKVADVAGGEGDADAVDGGGLRLLHARLLGRLDRSSHLRAIAAASTEAGLRHGTSAGVAPRLQRRCPSLCCFSTLRTVHTSRGRPERAAAPTLFPSQTVGDPVTEERGRWRGQRGGGRTGAPS